MTQSIEDSLLSAIEIIAKGNDKSLQFDKTIECEIIRPVDSSTGEYKVRYLNGTFSAYDDSLKMSYRQGQTVYVQIPRNDMSLKKLILGNKSINPLELKDATQDDERVDTLGMPIQWIYKFPDESGNLIDFSEEYGIYGSTETGGYHKVFEPTVTEQVNKVFQSYAKDKTALMISAQFKTDWYIPNGIEAGNYGIEVYFNTKDGQLSRYVLDRKNMSGNSLNYSDWQSNYAILLIDGNNLESLNHICFYSENFKRTDGLTEEQLADKLESGDAEIFVKDISIQFVQEIDKDGYTVSVSALDGYYFEAGDSVEVELRFQAVLKYNGSADAIDQSKAQYYWYRQDSRVSILNENYDELAGVGWIKETDKTGSFISILKSDFMNSNILQRKYKVVVLYDDYKATAEFDVYYNVDNIYQYEMKLIKSADGRSGDLVVEPKTAGYTTSWLSIDSNGVDQVEESDEDFALRNIDIANIYQGKTFYCTIFKDGIAVYTLNQTIYNTTDVKDFDVEFEVDNNGIFYYNEYGDLPQNFLTQKNIRFNIVLNGSEDNFTYSYKWGYPESINVDNLMFNINPESNLSGTELTQDKFISFTIDRRFNRSAAEDNIIQLQIIADGVTYNFYKELQFIKEGDPGTNGTSLIMNVELIGPNKAILANSQSTIPLNIQMYYNGKASYNGQNVNTYFNFSVSVPNDYKLKNPLYAVKDNIQLNNSTLVIPAIPYSQNTPNSIIQISATSNNKDIFPYNIKYLLPIAQTDNSAYQTYEYLGPTIVMYDEQGYEPKFDETISKVVDNNGNVVISQFNVLDNLNINADENIIIPPVYFNPNEFVMAVYAEHYTQPIVGTLNAYSKSILNAWDGSSIEINEDGSYILASQMGAGYKESDNTFSGVLMGILNKEDNSKQTGLMGFSKGISTFGFLSDGSAYIGKPSKGRIEFNPMQDKILIQSSNYISSGGSQGTSIDLADGKIKSNNLYLKSSALLINSPENQFSFDIHQVSGDTGYFKVYDSSKKNIIYLSGKSQYIQSSNYEPSSGGEGQGTNINLADGRIISNNLYLRSSALLIDSPNNIFRFNIQNTTSDDTGYFKVFDSNGKDMIHLSGSSQYIQSSDYSSGSGDDAVSGLRIDLKNGSLRAPGFWITSGGSAHFSGSLEAASGTFGGRLTAATGSFSGTLSAGKIEGSEISGSTISGGSISGTSITGTSIEGGTLSGATIVGGSLQIGCLYASGENLNVCNLNFYGTNSFSGNAATISAESHGGYMHSLTFKGSYMTIQSNVGNIHLKGPQGAMDIGNADNNLNLHSAISGGLYVQGGLYVEGGSNMVAVFG